MSSQKRSSRDRRKKKAALNLQTLEHLSHRLSVPLEFLKSLSRSAPFLYRHYNHKSRTKIRQISEPWQELKRVQRNVLKLLQSIWVPRFAQGAVQGRSNISNATLHLRRNMVLVADIKNCFPSIPYYRIYRTFLDLKCSPDVASCLTRLVTVNGSLPQGAPTSSLVAALVLLPLGRRLEGLAKTYGGSFSIYIDDLTFSGPPCLRKQLHKIHKIVEQEGFVLHPDKIAIMGSQEEQVVTGVSVNRGLDVPRAKIEEIRYLLKHAPLDNRLDGKISYAHQIHPGRGKQLRQQRKAAE